MLRGVAGRDFGSESSAWYAVGVLAAIQLTFNFVAPELARWAIPYAVLSSCLCLLAIGVALTSLDGVVKRGIAISASLLLLLLSLAHLATAKPVPLVDIEVTREQTISIDDEESMAGEAAVEGEEEEDRVQPPTPLATFKTIAQGIEVESRIDQMGRVHRLSWRLSRGADTLRCGPIFVGGTRAQADALLQRRLAASLVSSEGAKLFCE